MALSTLYEKIYGYTSEVRIEAQWQDDQRVVLPTDIKQYAEGLAEIVLIARQMCETCKSIDSSDFEISFEEDAVRIYRRKKKSKEYDEEYEVVAEFRKDGTVKVYRYLNVTRARGRAMALAKLARLARSLDEKVRNLCHAVLNIIISDYYIVANAEEHCCDITGLGSTHVEVYKWVPKPWNPDSLIPYTIFEQSPSEVWISGDMSVSKIGRLRKIFNWIVNIFPALCSFKELKHYLAPIEVGLRDFSDKMITAKVSVSPNEVYTDLIGFNLNVGSVWYYVTDEKSEVLDIIVDEWKEFSLDKAQEDVKAYLKAVKPHLEMARLIALKVYEIGKGEIPTRTIERGCVRAMGYSGGDFGRPSLDILLKCDMTEEDIMAVITELFNRNKRRGKRRSRPTA